MHAMPLWSDQDPTKAGLVLFPDIAAAQPLHRLDTALHCSSMPGGRPSTILLLAEHCSSREAWWLAYILAL
jgi:hypothetical protein